MRVPVCFRILGVFVATMALAADSMDDPCSLEMGSNPFDQKTLRHFDSIQGALEASGLQADLSDLMSEAQDRVKVPVIIHERAMEASDFNRIMHPDYEAPNDAGLIMAFRAPSSFSMKDCGKSQMSLNESSGNSMVHGQTIYKNSGESRYQRVDAIGQVTELKAEKKLGPGDCVGSISVSARVFGATGGGRSFSPLDQFTGDRFIEMFHSAIGYNDPFLRKKLGLDQLNVLLRDPQGRTFSMDSRDESSLYLMPIRVSADQYKRLIDDENSKTTLNYGAQAQIPLQKPFGQAGGGVHANVVNTSRIAQNWLVSYGAGIALNVQRSVLGGYDPSDRKLAKTYNGTLAAGLTRVDDDGKGRTSFILTVEKSSALLKRRDYQQTILPESTSFLSSQSMSAAVDPEVAVGLVIRRQSGNSTYQLMCKEDRNPKLPGFIGNNNQDWFCAVSKSVQF